MWIETLWDGLNIAMGVANIGDSWNRGDGWGVAIDTLGVIGDAAATVLPLIPAGIGTARAAYKAGSWASRGLDAINDGKRLSTEMRDAFRSNARDLMAKNNPAYEAAKKAGKEVEVHHNIPLEYAHKMGKDFDPNKALSAYEKSVHQKISKEWSQFKRDMDAMHKEPGKDDISKFADYIKKEYKEFEIQ